MSKVKFDPDSPDGLERERAICLEKDCGVRKVLKELEQCEGRLEQKPYTAETCHQETTDLFMALDHCVGSKAFNKLR